MKKTLLSIMLLAFVLNLSAQENAIVSTKSDNTWAFKGKVLPWVFLGSGINYSAGVEYGFKGTHSLGVDFVYNDKSFEHDVYDNAKKEYVSGPRMYTVARGLFLNYRRYMPADQTIFSAPLHKVFGDACLPYYSAFLRYGKTDYHYDPGFDRSQISYDEWQYSSGLLLGVVYNFFDINMGPFYKQTYITDVQSVNGATVYNSHLRPSLGFRVGVNLFLVAKRQSKHLLAKSCPSLRDL